MDSILLSTAFAVRSDLGDSMAKDIRTSRSATELIEADDELAQAQQRIADRRKEIGSRLAGIYSLTLPGVAA